MCVLALPALRDFWEKYPESEQPLKAWFTALESATPSNFSELKTVFNSVDLVPDKSDSVPWHVFDVGGNKYRIICKISYRTQYALIKYVLSHREYDQWTKENR